MSTSLTSTPSLYHRSITKSAPCIRTPRSLLTSLGNLHIITTHLPLPHPAVLRERPVLETITPLPLQPIMRIAILIPKLDRNLIVGEGEELLAQLVALFLLPFLGQEVLDFSVAAQE